MEKIFEVKKYKKFGVSENFRYWKSRIKNLALEKIFLIG